MDEVKNCVYRFLDKDGNILYVGSTEMLLKNRLSCHNSGHLCDCCKLSTVKVEYIIFPTVMDIKVAELYYINKYQPPYNTRLKHEDGITYTIDQLDKMDWTEYKEKIPFTKQKYSRTTDLKELVEYYMKNS